MEAGHGVVAAHGATSSYLENPRWAELLGASYTEHGNDLDSIAIVKPEHPSQTGVSRPRRGTRGGCTAPQAGPDHPGHRQYRETPWTWVRPQGKGWVYYTSSGHDERVWKDLNYQKTADPGAAMGLCSHPCTAHMTFLGPGGPHLPGDRRRGRRPFRRKPGVDALGTPISLPAGQVGKAHESRISDLRVARYLGKPFIQGE